MSLKRALNLVIPEYEAAFANNSCLFILDPDKLRFDDAMRPVIPMAIPIPKINICGIANPSLFIFFFWNINHYRKFTLI